MNCEEHAKEIVELLKKAPGWEEMPKYKTFPAKNSYRIRFIGIKDGSNNGFELDYRFYLDEDPLKAVNSILDGNREPVGFFNSADREIYLASIAHLPRRVRRHRLKLYDKEKKDFHRR